MIVEKVKHEMIVGSGLAMMHPRLNSLDCPAHRHIMNPEVIRYLFHDKGTHGQ